jgi:hypothetical protein
MISGIGHRKGIVALKKDTPAYLLQSKAKQIN